MFSSHLEICMNNLYGRHVKFNGMIGKTFRQNVMEGCKSLLTYNLCRRIPPHIYIFEMLMERDVILQC